MRARIDHILDIFQDRYIKLKARCGLSLGLCKKYQVVAPQLLGQPVSVFKPETHETVKLMRVYGFIESGEFSVKYPEIDLWRFDQASFIGSNDFVIKGENVFWDKLTHYNFAKNIASDKNLVEYTENYVTLKNVKCTKKLDLAYSILGVHATVWSHSLSEYFTKISALSKILELESGIVKVLVPVYKDKQLKQIMYDTLSRYDRIEIIPIEDGECVCADRLYYLPRPATFTDHETYVSIGDDIQPKIVSDIIKRDLVGPLVNNVEDTSSPRKLFLVRRATHRVLSNNEDVENLFKANGYFLLDPSKITLEEKVKLFYNADEIVGPFSSAFSNLIFSKPGTKVLMFSNYQRVFENWLSMHYQHFDINMWFVTGYDISKSNSAHSNFYISLDKIVLACGKVGIEIKKI